MCNNSEELVFKLILLSQLVLLTSILWLALPALQCTTPCVRCTEYATTLILLLCFACSHKETFPCSSSRLTMLHSVYGQHINFININLFMVHFGHWSWFSNHVTSLNQSKWKRCDLMLLLSTHFAVFPFLMQTMSFNLFSVTSQLIKLWLMTLQER